MTTTLEPCASRDAPMPGHAGRRIVVTTWGSFGDLHPYLAVGRRLVERGHEVTLATSAAYGERARAEGLRFHAVRPDHQPSEVDKETLRRAMHPRGGSKFILTQMLMPHLREQYDDLVAAARGADLLITHPVTFAAPLVAQKLGLPWVSTALQPLVFMSAADPPAPVVAPWLARVARAAPLLARAGIALARPVLRRWLAPVERLRAELGLPPGGHPMFAGSVSPHLHLALFSSTFAAPQPDWPPQTVVTGFPFYDRLEAGRGLPEELEAFLQSGPPPLVFTLGSAAVLAAGDFYLHSIEAARRLGRRAVLLVGPTGWNALPQPLPRGVLAVDYAPHGDLFPRACAVVHQGGVGTTGQSLRAGRPVLVVPFAHDQGDNAERVRRLGAGFWLPRSRYSGARAAAALRRLLEVERYALRAGAVARSVRAEDGASAACDAIEALLGVLG